MQRLLIMCTLFITTLASAKPEINLAITSYDESIGNIPRSTAGYLAWEEAGWKEYFEKYLNPDKEFRDANAIQVCTVKDFNQKTYSRCMTGAMVHSMQKSLTDFGLPVLIKFTLAYSKFPNLDVACKGNCIRDATFKWQASTADADIILMPYSNGSQGYTIASKVSGKLHSVTALVAGAQQPYAILHLFRHEMAHVLRFDGHLSDPDMITLNKNKAVFASCNQLDVKPYSLSGLKPGCEHRTYVGSNFGTNTCGNRTMGNSDFFGVGFDVPVYGTTFRYIFNCYLATLGPAPAPQPTPTPTPAPAPQPPPPANEYEKFCPTWKDLVARYCPK